MIIPIIIALLAGAGCALPPFGPSDDRPKPNDDRDEPDQNVGQDGQVVRDGGVADGGVDAAGGSDLGKADGKTDMGSDAPGDRTLADQTDGSSEYIPPTPQRPINQSTLPPTQGFFKWRNNIPAGRSVTDEILCETTGDPSSVGNNCFSIQSANSCYTADPLEKSANYSWQVQSCYDGGECSAFSALQTFSTDDSLQARWRLDEGNGDIAADTSGVSTPNDGELRNFPASPRWTNGVRGSALQFNGTGSAVYVGDKLGGMPELTVCAWTKTTSPGVNRAIVSRFASGLNSYALTLSDLGGGKARFSTYTTTPVDIDSTTVINDGNWHLLCGTYDGVEQKLYVDGNLEATAPQTGAISSMPAELCIGDFCSGGAGLQLGLEGFIDEVTILDRALNIDQVINDYCAPYCSPNSNLGSSPAICNP